MRRCTTYVTAFVALLSGQAVADDPVPQVLESNFRSAHISVTADRTVTAIVDPVQVSISVETLVGLAIALPSGKGTMGPFRVLSERDAGPFWAGEGRQRWERHYTLRAIAAGEQQLPSLPVLVEDENTINHFACVRMDRCGGELMPAGSEMRRLRTRPLPLSVTSVLPDDAVPTRPKGVAPPLELIAPSPLPSLGKILGVLGIVAVGALALAVFLKRKLSATCGVRARRHAHNLALAALKRLAGLDAARVHEFHARLSAILRTYLVGRFGLPASKRTTEEILLATETAPHDALGPTLSQCDRVKFGRGRPTESDMRARLRAAEAFVEETAAEA